MATATSAWAKPGAWALESEQLASTETPNPSPDFPSLAAAAASKSSKKKKPQTLSLAEFAGANPSRRSSDEVLLLPTGPRERSAAELERPARGSGYSRRSEISRVSGDDLVRISRADEAEDWGSMKRSERRERVLDSQSRADEVESWVSKKSGAVSGEGPREKKGGFEIFSRDRSGSAVSGVDSDSWGRKKEEISRADSESWGRKREEGNGRPRLVLQPRTAPRENREGNGEADQVKGLNPFGFARPREEVLAEKGRDWKEIDEKLESAKIRERISDEISAGRKGRRLGSGNLAEDCTEKSWRKEVASDAVVSMKEDQTEASLLN